MRTEEALRIIRRPYITEKTFELIERENKLVFIVMEDAGKKAIKSAVETLYDVKVDAVNTSRTVQGKKAYVKFLPESPATDLASKLGLV